MSHEPPPTNDKARNTVREVRKQSALLCGFAFLDAILPPATLSR